MKRKTRITVALFILIVLAAGITAWYKLYRDVPQPSWITSDRSDTFLNGWIASGSNSGIPYWIWLALPRMFPEYIHYPGGYAAFGVSWEQGKEMPAGFAKKTIGYTRVSGNCALCHAASYRKGADEAPEVVAAVPGHTLDIERLLTFFQQCAQDPRFNASEILAEVSMATKLSIVDSLIYRFVLIPRTRRALLDKQSLIDPALLAHGHDPHTDPLFPNESMNGLATWVKELRAPKYPLPIDENLADMGKRIFEKQCAGCHAPGPGSRMGTVIPIAEIGTAREQLDIWTKAANQTNTGRSLDSAHKEMVKNGGYVAPRLDGIWVRGPYLHNGSVPTVSDLLKSQGQRPQKFFPGNDLIDALNVGFVSDVAEEPGRRKFSQYDTTQAGNGNSGHSFGTALSNIEKSALLEYVKTL